MKNAEIDWKIILVAHNIPSGKLNPIKDILINCCHIFTRENFSGGLMKTGILIVVEAY